MRPHHTAARQGGSGLIMKRFVLTALIAALVSGCGLPAASPVGAKLLIGQAPTARPALVAVAAPTSRVLAEGAFTLPASLVSIGTGGLVSIGSGGLVSIGSGGLVSVGSGGYKMLAVLDGGAAAQPREGAPDVVAVPGALITLARPRGEAIDAAFEVAPAQSDAAGGYRLHGRAPAGLYRVAATIGGHTFMTLVALTSDAPAQAPVDAATTLVAARVLADNPTGDLSVLPMQAFGQSVAAVRVAIAAGALPTGWTPDRAAATMVELERGYPAVASAMKQLRERRDGLEQREDAFGYRLQELAASLGVTREVVAGELHAVLSVAPEATDAEIDAEITSAVRRRTAPADAPTPAPSASAAPTEEAGKGEGAPAGAPATTPSDAPSALPTGDPSGAPAGSPAGEPSGEEPSTAIEAAPAEGATEDDEAIDHAMAKEDRRSQAKSKHKPAQPENPSTEPGDTPVEEDEAEGEDEGEPTDTPSEAPGEPAEDSSGDEEPGNGAGNGNAGGNGNGNNAGGNGNGNANGQNGTQGQGNGGTNNGNDGATNGNGTGNP